MAQILIVDDEKMIVMLLGEALRRNGHVVVTAFSGEEGLAAARDQRPDLVVSDVQMPGMSGFELVWQLNHLMPDTSCILMSGNAFEIPEKYRDELDALQVAAILRKPFQMGAFFEVVNDALERLAERRNCVGVTSSAVAQQCA